MWNDRTVEGLAPLRRAVALRVQAIGDLAGGATGPVQLEHATHQRRVFPQLLEAADGPPALGAPDDAPGQVDDAAAPLVLALARASPPLVGGASAAPPIRGRRGLRPPEGGDVRCQ